MAPIVVDPKHVREFVDFDAFYGWLADNHASAPEVWIKIHKKGSGLPSINHIEAIDAVLCWGWIDAVRKGFDEKSFLQRYVPRGRKSVWSQVNVANVARLIEAGRMTEHGLKQVEAAKADGRWDAAYRVKGSTVPDDLQAALDADAKAKAFFETLTAQNRFALIFRLQSLKTEAGRRKRIEATLNMLRKGETIYPQASKS
ncbi:YdeI/OmpD-associated family protein [Brevundimonas kwangchunensis]|uniref:YdeI/OmpD-associated family protein n=1 Tax=Brevundimonas kwangchunensis TaxID=322163 RepID=A0ABN1GSJ3_9CAUL